MDNLPQCFKDKIVLDKDWDEMKKDRVVPYISARSLKLRRDTARYQCMALIKKQRGTGGGAANG